MDTTTRRRPTLVALALVLTSVAWLLPAATSWAYVEVAEIAEDTVTFDEDAEGAGPVTSEVVTPTTPFSMVGAEAPAGARVEVQVQDPTGTWSDWWMLPDGHDHSPDAASDEHDHAARGITDPVFVDHGVALRVRVAGAAPDEVDVTVLDAHNRGDGAVERIRVPASAAAAADAPRVRSRSTWGAAAPRTRPSYSSPASYLPSSQQPDGDLGPRYDVVGAGVVHHTAGETWYSANEVPGIIRGIQRFHQSSRGWNDIGYNFVVDRFGRIWEGRAGGTTRSVIGAHAGGHNSTSFGTVVLGNFVNGAAPTGDAVDGLVELLAWKFALHGIDPRGTHRWPNGTVRTTLIGHRDVGSTTCPGAIHGMLPALRTRVAQQMARLDIDEPAPPPSLPDDDATYPDVFDDVRNGGTNAQSIFKLAAEGIILGCDANSFCPRRPITRGQIASLFAKAFELPPDHGEPPFRDVAPNSPHRLWVGALVDHGAINGFGDGTYRAQIPISRGQIATILGKTLGLSPSTLEFYRDVSNDDPLSGYIHAMRDARIMHGCGNGRFCSDRLVARGQVATLLDRALTYAEDNDLQIGPG